MAGLALRPSNGSRPRRALSSTWSGGCGRGLACSTPCATGWPGGGCGAAGAARRACRRDAGPDRARPARRPHRDPPRRAWRGRLRLLFDAEGSGTRVRVVADLDEDGLRWLMRRRGYPVREPTDRRRPPRWPADQQVRPRQRLRRRHREPRRHGRRRDQRRRRRPRATSAARRRRRRHGPGVGRRRRRRRLVRGGCRTIVAGTTSATYARVSDALRADGVLLVHAVMNEGGQGGELRIRLGERPHQQLRRRGRARHAGGGRAAVVPRGNDYVWPRAGARLRPSGGRRAAWRRRRRGVRAARHPRLHPRRRGGAGVGRRRRAVVVRGRRPGGVRTAVPRDGAAGAGPDARAHARRARPANGSATSPRRACAGSRATSSSSPTPPTPSSCAATAARSGRSRRRWGASRSRCTRRVHLYAAAARRAGEDEPRTVARELGPQPRPTSRAAP